MKNLLLLAFIMISTGLMAQKADSVKKTSAMDSVFNSMSVDNKKDLLQFLNLRGLFYHKARKLLRRTTLISW